MEMIEKDNEISVHINSWCLRLAESIFMISSQEQSSPAFQTRQNPHKPFFHANLRETTNFWIHVQLLQID